MAKRIVDRFTKILTLQDFDWSSSGSDITLQANQWTLVTTYTVGAQLEVALGITEAIAGGAQGLPVYMRFDSTAGALFPNAMLRIQIKDANEFRTGRTIEDSIARWSSSATNRETAKLLPEDKQIRAGEDSLIQIWIKVPTVTTWSTVDVSDTDNAVEIPCTFYTVER